MSFLRGLLFVLLFVCKFAFSAPVAAVADPASFDIDALPVAQLIRLVYVQAFPEVAYTVDPAVLVDQRPVSFRWTPKQGAFRPFFAEFLARLGYSVISRSGADSIGSRVVAQPLAAVDDPSKEVFIYLPKFREGSYLVDLLSPLFAGHFTGQRRLGIEPPSDVSGAASSSGSSGAGSSGTVQPASGSLLDDANRKPDRLVFVGSPSEVKKLVKLLDQVDTPVGEVLVKAYVYEVGTSVSDSSALKLALSALGGRVQLAAGVDPVANLVRLKTSAIEAVASALSADSRFKIVTAPYQRVRSGKTARFVSGSQVSILGAVVSNTNGSTQQSYERQDSGTILEISPVVRGQVVEVDLFEQVSSFTKSDISSQPTLNKRELRSSLSVQDGEVVVIAGLENTQDEDTKGGLSFLPFSLSKSKSKSSSQLLLILEVKRI